MPLPGRQADEVQSATLRKAKCCYLGRPSATQAEQEKLRESLASLFPAYPADQDGGSGPAVAEAGAAPPATGYEDLQQRAFALEAAFQIDPSLNEDLREATAILEKDVRQVLQWRSGELKNSGKRQVASEKTRNE
jgi:hypothetical protein